MRGGITVNHLRANVASVPIYRSHKGNVICGATKNLMDWMIEISACSRTFGGTVAVVLLRLARWMMPAETTQCDMIKIECCEP